jgi:hypothetical protein
VSRYIDADEFGKIFKLHQVLLEGSAEFNFAIYSSLKNRDKARAKAYARLVKEIINDQSITADVVEVVRCKDCKYFKREEHGPMRWCDHPSNIIVTKANPERLHVLSVSNDHYCAYGERSENERT